MLVRYIGPAQRIVIAGTGQVVPRGETVEVDDELGADLLRQSRAWAPADPDPDDTPDHPAPRRRRTQEA